MIYKYNDRILNIYQDGILSMTQPHNPITLEKFETEESALDWLIHHIKTSHGAEPIRLNISLEKEIESENQELVKELIPLEPGNGIEIPKGTPFSICVVMPSEISPEKIEILMTGMEFKKYEVPVLNNLAKKTLVLEDTGTYDLEFIMSCTKCIDSETQKVSIHEKGAYKITIV